MRQSNRRVLTIDGEKYVFNNAAFKNCIESFAKKNSMTREAVKDQLAGSLGVTKNGVTKWEYGDNGISAPNRLMEIAGCLHVDWRLLVRKLDGGKPMISLNDRQKSAAKRIYDTLIWFLEEYDNSDGFQSWRGEFRARGVADPEDAVYERLTRMEERVRLVLSQEYFDLHDQELYDELCEFAGVDLKRVYTGRLGSEDLTEIWQAYEVARQRLNEIIERIR